jgi:hypothetical protein
MEKMVEIGFCQSECDFAIVNPETDEYPCICIFDWDTDGMPGKECPQYGIQIPDNINFRMILENTDNLKCPTCTCLNFEERIIEIKNGKIGNRFAKCKCCGNEYNSIDGWIIKTPPNNKKHECICYENDET